MYFTIYMITNNINGKIYIGAHKTKNLDDDYMGSGKYLKRAQEKYGLENFSKEILNVLDNADDMFELESELVNEEFVARKDTYNLKVGGFGGWDHLSDYIGSEEHLNNLSKVRHLGGIKGSAKRKQMLLDDPDLGIEIANKRKNTMRERFPDGQKTFLGKSHTEEAKRKIGEKNSVHQTGSGNSQYGTMWIFNTELQENKRIHKDDFCQWEEQGWQKGRKMKF